jgi:hypothetical protein
MAFQVLFAAYGALRDGNENNAEAADVTLALQQQLNANPSGVVHIANENLGGDPANGVLKHFGAIVEVNGNRSAFACQEDQTIDFS